MVHPNPTTICAGKAGMGASCKSVRTRGPKAQKGKKKTIFDSAPSTKGESSNSSTQNMDITNIYIYIYIYLKFKEVMKPVVTKISQSVRIFRGVGLMYDLTVLKNYSTTMNVFSRGWTVAKRSTSLGTSATHKKNLHKYTGKKYAQICEGIIKLIIICNNNGDRVPEKMGKR